MRALIIEDQFIVATMIEAQLRDCGYDEIEIVGSEECAVAAAAERSPDLITADDRLEAGSGVDAVRRICAERPIPVVFIVGNPSALEAVGPNMVVLEKPFSSAALELAIVAARDMTQPRPHLPLVS